jgi:hypothetical protein
MASRIGKYSGRHPAMTPLTATDHTVAWRSSMGSTPITSSGDRAVWARKASTRLIVGGTKGRPSLHWRSWKWSRTSSRVPATTMSLAWGSVVASAAAALACPRPSRMADSTGPTILSSSCGVVSMGMTPGYSTTQVPSMPSALAVDAA